MRKILTALVILLTAFSSASLAQGKTGKIAGTVIDGNTKTIESASIHLLRAKDSAVVKMSVADKTGKYEFDGIAEGSYLVSITAVGHSKGYSETFEITGSNQLVTLKTIELVPQAKALGGVTVNATKPLVEQKIDRMVVNVDAAVTNVGATALEVLEKSPGVTVDKDGNISLKGKQSVQVFIDGKPAYLSGAELVNMLSNMNANQLEQIELMTNPPARYDAAGNSGIINLKTKKSKQVGFNGSATAGYSQGKYWKTNESLNMNYRKNKVNAFMNYSFNRNKSSQELIIHRTFLRPDQTVNAIFDQRTFMPRFRNNNNLKLGMDYFLSKKTTLGFVASGSITSGWEKNYNTAYLKNDVNALDSIVYATNTTDQEWKNGSLNLNLRHIFDSTGRELTADADYSRYASKSNQAFTNTSYTPDWTKKTQTDLLGILPVGVTIYSAKVDYSHPMKSGWKAEAGLKSSYVSTDNEAEYYTKEANAWEPDYSKTNQFVYKENINAGYLNLNRQFKKWGVQTGLRFENTNYKGHQLGNPQKPDSSFKKSYNSFFPTVYLTYKANEKNQFGINLGRRIDRPSYQSLNPFLYYLDNYTYEAGNPFIRPQFTWNAEVSHTYKGFLTTTINYSRTTDFMTETFEQFGDNITIVRDGNIGVRQTAGIAISAQVKPAKWWNASLFGNYNYNQFKGELYKEYVNIEASNVLFNVNNQFKFNKGWSAELSGFYRTKGVEGQIIIQPMGQMSAGVSKVILKGKGTIRLNVRDILYTNRAKGRIDFQQTKARFENNRDTRVAGIAFTWRFGKPIKAAQNNRKTGGADEEQNRIKTDN
jgi:iron complex outermembrane receptor protein